MITEADAADARGMRWLYRNPRRWCDARKPDAVVRMIVWYSGYARERVDRLLAIGEYLEAADGDRH